MPRLHTCSAACVATCVSARSSTPRTGSFRSTCRERSLIDEPVSSGDSDQGRGAAVEGARPTPASPPADQPWGLMACLVFATVGFLTSMGMPLMVSALIVEYHYSDG